MQFQKLSFPYFGNVYPRFVFLLSFIVPLIVRVLPEVFMGGFIVGFDTLSYYIPVTLQWIYDGVSFLEFMACAPLFYSLLAGLTLSGVPLTVSLKALPPVLHGFLGFAIYLYARKGLAWSYQKSFSVSCLATLYFVALRVSWDMLRSELGLIFLFVFLVFLHVGWKKKPLKYFGLLSSLMVLIVLTHQLVAVIMFAVVSVLILQKLLSHEYVEAGSLVLSALPAALLFGLTVYSRFVISGLSGGSEGWFSLFGFSSFYEVVVGTLGFFIYCYLPLLPFAVFGFRDFRNLELKVWVFWCLVGVLISIVSPFTFVPRGYRWILLLIFPLAFLAVEGFGRLNFCKWRTFLSGVLVFLSFSFVFLPTEVAFPYFGVFPYYVPSSMLQNSVPLSDCEDVVRVLSWFRDNVLPDGVLLVHDAFHGWAVLYLDRARILRYGYDDPLKAALEVVRDGYEGRLFLVWWISGEGWHGLASLPSCFIEVYRSGRMAVYEYDSTV